VPSGKAGRGGFRENLKEKCRFSFFSIGKGKCFVFRGKQEEGINDNQSKRFVNNCFFGFRSDRK
jgi:hypothetical protein